MKIIEPIHIQPELLESKALQVLPDYETLTVQPGSNVFEVLEVSTNVPEDDYPAWVPGTYPVDAWVMHKHRVWKALKETDKEPGAEDAADDWNDGGYTNRWRLFDQMISSKTTNLDSIDMSVSLGKKINALAFFDVEASGVRVRSIDPHQGIIFEKEVAPVSVEGIDNWWAWFFAPIELIKDFIISDIPSSSFGTVQVTLTRTGGLVAIGELVVGTEFEIGCALYGSEFGITDYSLKQQDEFGNWTIVERGFSKRAEYDISVKTRDTGAIQRKLAQYRAKPVVWIGSPDLEMSVIYGYYKDFSIVISGPTVSDGTISVEGLN